MGGRQRSKRAMTKASTTSPRSAVLGTVACCLLLPAVFLWPMLVRGRPLVRDDASLFVYPMYKAMAECLRGGHLYLWDPAQYCGLPAFAAGQTGLLYPPHLLLFRLLPWMAALHVSYWLHLSLALLAFVWVCRNLGLRWAAAVTGGMVYVFSGYTAAHLVHYNFITMIAHVPLLLACLQTALRREEWRWWGLLGLEIALAYLCGHPQIFIMGLTAGLLWVLVGQWVEDGAGLRGALRRVPGLAVAALLALLLVMPQLLSTLEMARLSREAAPLGGMGAASYMASYPFRLLDLVRVLLPDLFGTAEANVIGGGPSFHETCAFVGAGGLLLAWIGAVTGWRRPGWLFALTLVVVGATLMPAGNPLYRLAVSVPFISGFRAMGRWAILPLLGGGLLIAFAIQYLPLVTERQRHLVRLIASWKAAVFLFALFALWLTFGAEGGRLTLPAHPQAAIVVRNMAAAIYNSLVGWEPLLVSLGLIGVALSVLARDRAPYRGGRLLLVLIALAGPLWHFWEVTNQTGDPAYYQTTGRVAQFSQAVAGGRVVYLPAELVDPAGRNRPAAFSSEVGSGQPYERFRETMPPALGTVFGLRYADGYKQGLVTPSTLRWWQDGYRYSIQTATGESTTTGETVARVGTPAERMKRFHRLMGVQALLVGGRLEDPELRLVADWAVRLYRYRTPPPRAWLVGETIAVSDPQAQLEAIKEREFDPDRVAVVDGVPLAARGVQSPGTARVVSEDNLEVTVQTDSERDAALILADAWYPGWQARVDGRPAPVMRANYCARAVAVPAGSHQVVFRFVPVPWRRGLMGLALGVVLLAALLFWRPRQEARDAH